MSDDSPNKFDSWLDLIDLDAIADPDDKIAECEYFFTLASTETNVQHFRWLISAFFGAAYSYFEIRAMWAFHGFSDPSTGESVEDSEALVILRRYVNIIQNPKNPRFIKTSGSHPITMKLYELRKGNTHHYPLTIKRTGKNLPEDFYFGYKRNNGTPVFAFCKELMSLINNVQAMLQS
ncbi:MAG: hypothetical protein KGZ88_04475 [Methylomicrobium sp.]|nr:hypothetical protein [Methylomicrobium sp.]